MSGLSWFAAAAALRQIRRKRLFVICYCHLCNNGIPCSSRSILTAGSGDDERRG